MDSKRNETINSFDTTSNTNTSTQQQQQQHQHHQHLITMQKLVGVGNK
jgi:hypothetical protein